MRRGAIALMAACALVIAGALVSTRALAAGQRSCGLLVVSPAQADGIYSLNRVSESDTSCTAARRLVRAWAIAAAHNRIPARVIEATNSHHVLLLGRPGARYRFDKAVCRWTNTTPGHGYLPGHGLCRRGAAVVAWSYHGSLNPSLGPTRGCAAVGWHDGGATVVRARGIACSTATRIVRALLDGGAIGHRGGRFDVRRPTVDGFHLRATGADGRVIVAQRGRARISFALCWYNVDC